MSNKYTEEDFANAKFAEHEGGLRYARDQADPDWWMGTDGEIERTEYLAEIGAVPVRPQQAWTVSELDKSASRLFYPWSNVQAFRDELRTELRWRGIEVAPDPVPTNAELLAKEMLESFNRCEFDREPTWKQMAEALDARGVKAPEGNA